MEDPDTEDTVLGVRGTRAPGIPLVDEATLVDEETRVAEATPVDEATVVKLPWALIVPPERHDHRARTRSLGNAAVEPTSAPAPRTARYQVRVNDQLAIPLDRPVVVGRRPRFARIAPDATPELVQVASPLNEVSSTHLKVHQHGTSIIVVDLHSTNGTVVRMPGAPPLTLRSGESLVVVPGARVDIGDGNIVEILATKRIVPPEPGPFERLSP